MSAYFACTIVRRLWRWVQNGKTIFTFRKRHGLRNGSEEYLICAATTTLSLKPKTMDLPFSTTGWRHLSAYTRVVGHNRSVTRSYIAARSCARLCSYCVWSASLLCSTIIPKSPSLVVDSVPWENHMFIHPTPSSQSYCCTRFFIVAVIPIRFFPIERTTLRTIPVDQRTIFNGFYNERILHFTMYIGFFSIMSLGAKVIQCQFRNRFYFTGFVIRERVDTIVHSYTRIVR